MNFTREQEQEAQQRRPKARVTSEKCVIKRPSENSPETGGRPMASTTRNRRMYKKRRLRGSNPKRQREYGKATPTPAWKKAGPQKARREDMQDTSHPDAKSIGPVAVILPKRPDLQKLELEKVAKQHQNLELHKRAQAKLIAKRRQAVVTGRRLNCPVCGAGHRARKGKPGDESFITITPCCPSFVREMQRAFDPDDYEDYFAAYTQPPELSQTRVWYEGSAIQEAPWFKALNPIQAAKLWRPNDCSA